MATIRKELLPWPIAWNEELAMGLKEFLQNSFNPKIFKFRMGSVCIELYHIIAREHVMDKEKYLSELQDALAAKGKNYKYIIACWYNNLVNGGVAAVSSA